MTFWCLQFSKKTTQKFDEFLPYVLYGDFNFKIFGISKKRGHPIKVLENDVWKTGFRLSLVQNCKNCQPISDLVDK